VIRPASACVKLHSSSAVSSIRKNVSASVTACAKAPGSTWSNTLRYSGLTTAWRKLSTAPVLLLASYICTTGPIVSMNCGALGTVSNAGSNSAREWTASVNALAAADPITPSPILRLPK
jgi:hypothetical protein